MGKKSKSKPKKSKSLLKAVSAKASPKGIIGAVSSAVSGRSSKGTGRRRRGKRGIAWYAREITRLKLKKRYEKVKYSVR